MPRIPIKIKPHCHLADHHFMGQPILPAVEAMEILAAAVKQNNPDLPVTTISDARFDKFLPVNPDHPTTGAFADLQQPDSGKVEATLATKTKAPKAAITRTKIHAQLCFDGASTPSGFVPLDVAAAPEGICTKVDPEKIYNELVPFGSAYANINAPLWLSPDGALAAIQGPDLPTTSGSNHLGTPFVLDAAFHAACVWGQHFHNVVAFPVAIGQRRVLHPTQPNTLYFGRVVPRKITPTLFSFDIWLLDEKGRTYEIISDLQMRDVSGGRLKPPEWIVQPKQPDPLAIFRPHCCGVTLMELDALAPYASAALSTREENRMIKMAPRRKKSYLAARMALKRLGRHLQNGDHPIHSQAIQTVSDDLVKPCCTVSAEAPHVHCSASHDERFAIAVTADQPVGVDVEVVSPRTVECSTVYMSDQESALMANSPLGEEQAATRIWSLKEAVVKTLGLDLATAWRRAQVRSINEHETRFVLDGKRNYSAIHATEGNHLFTLFCQPNDTAKA